MKNKNKGGCVLPTQPDQQKKAPMQKCAKNEVLTCFVRDGQNFSTCFVCVCFFLCVCVGGGGGGGGGGECKNAQKMRF